LTLTVAIDARPHRSRRIGSYVRNLVNALAQIEDETRYVLLVSGEEDRIRSLPDNFQFLHERSPAYSLRELLSLSWSLFRQKIDVFHSTHYVLPAFLPCPSVMTVHDIVHLLHPDFLPNRLALSYSQRMIRRTLGRAEMLIATSQNIKTDMLEYFDVPPQGVRVVYNGVEERFHQPLEPEELQRWLKTLELEQPYLLFVGDPDQSHKNLDNVVKAYASARERARFDAPLICVGAREGSDFKILQRARQLGIGDRVRLLGDVATEALPGLYQGASVFLFPTLYEGPGLPVVEAMASGVAVITSNTSTMREIAEGYAHLVPPFDIDEIANAIAQCISDGDHRAALAKHGLRRARDFSWDVTARKTLDCYRSAARSTGGRAE
jgi:glycosyltransferase involved in cell wall biosynthesis